MKKENLKETMKNLSIVNMLKTKNGYVLVTEDSSKIGEQNKNDGWLLLDQDDFYFITEEADEPDYCRVYDSPDGKEKSPAERNELYRRLLNFREFREFMGYILIGGIKLCVTNPDGSETEGIEIGIIKK